MDEVLDAYDEPLQTDSRGDRAWRLHALLFGVHDGADHNPRPEDVDYHGMDIPVAVPGFPAGRLRLARNRRNTDVHHIRPVPECDYARYRSTDGKINVSRGVFR